MAEQSSQPRGMEEFEGDSKWFYKNIDSLRKENSGKYVAIKDKKIIASGKDIEIVVEMVEKKGENPAYIVMEFLYPEGTVILL
ncbi:hypothetical protein J4233_03715 [Candidatus Pacearchaeota archaeon]|nr:hypothetical protein [Candidatus Pacearchaeota archaeon]